MTSTSSSTSTSMSSSSSSSNGSNSSNSSSGGPTLGVFLQATADGWGNSSGTNDTGGGGGVLWSLPMADRAVGRYRASHLQNVTRPVGSVVAMYETGGGDNNASPVVLHYHVLAMLPLSDFRIADGRGPASGAAHEDAAAIALALHHLNTGDGSILPMLGSSSGAAAVRACPVGFTLEFLDTQQSPGATVESLFLMSVAQTGIEPSGVVGPLSSAIALPTALLTGHRGLVQISPAASSVDLDDAEQYPLFGRTVPPDGPIAGPILQYFAHVANVRHLAIVTTNDAFGGSFGEAVQLAALDLQNGDDTGDVVSTFLIRRLVLDVHGTNVDLVLDELERTRYRYILAAVGQPSTSSGGAADGGNSTGGNTDLHVTLLERAVQRDLAGNGKHQWFFADAPFFFPNPAGVIGTDIGGGNGGSRSLASALLSTAKSASAAATDAAMDGRHLQTDLLGLSSSASSPILLHRALQGVGVFRVASSGAVPTPGGDGGDGGGDDDDDDIRARYLRFESQMRALHNPTDLAYLDTIIPNVGRGGTNETDPTESYLDDPTLGGETFLNPGWLETAGFAYDATILVGLSACKAAMANGGGTFSGRDQFDLLSEDSVFDGVTGRVVLDRRTASRVANSTILRLDNVVSVLLPHRSGNETAKNATNMTIPRFHRIPSNFFDGVGWQQLDHEFVFHGGSNTPPPGLPPPEEDLNYVDPGIRAFAYSLCAISILLALGFAAWTYRNRKVRVVRASQPFFLYLVCFGVILVATSTITLSYDTQVASSDACSNACNASLWLFFSGIALVFSALYTKTYRINLIMQNAQKFKRVRVTILDTVKPMVVLLTLNIGILSVMQAIDPVQYIITVMSTDQFGRPTSAYGLCSFSQQKWYIMAAAILNFCILLLSIYQSWRARNLSTEFAESKSIFRALVCILLVTFIGAPVLILSKDSPDTTTFLVASMNFVSCMSILLFIFVNKIKFARRASHPPSGGTVHVSGLTPSPVDLGDTIGSGTGRPYLESDVTMDDAKDGDKEAASSSSSSMYGERIVATESAEKLARRVQSLEQMLRLAKRREIDQQKELDALRKDYSAGIKMTENELSLYDEAVALSSDDQLHDVSNASSPNDGGETTAQTSKYQSPDEGAVAAAAERAQQGVGETDTSSSDDQHYVGSHDREYGTDDEEMVASLPV